MAKQFTQELYEALNEKFKETLAQAAFEAKQLHAFSRSAEFGFSGTEVLDLDSRLREIYAAYTTGDKMDRSTCDEIFK